MVTTIKKQIGEIRRKSDISARAFYESLSDIANEALNLIYPNKKLYDMDNKRFGEIWGQGHVMSFDQRFTKAKPNMHHDILLESIKIEVKASRANSPANKDMSLFKRALPSSTKDQFMMNYMHIFLDEADFFVFLSVWRDSISYYLMSNADVRHNKYLNPYQTEFQMAITNNNIHEFEQFKIDPESISARILEIR